MRTDLAPFPIFPAGKDQEIQGVFAAYRANTQRFRHPGFRDLFGNFVREIFLSGYESPAHKAMSHYAGRLRPLLTYGTLLELVPEDNSPPLQVVIGRMKGEYSVADINGLSLYQNGEDGIYIPSDQFMDISRFATMRALGEACTQRKEDGQRRHPPPRNPSLFLSISLMVR